MYVQCKPSEIKTVYSAGQAEYTQQVGALGVGAEPCQQGVRDNMYTFQQSSSSMNKPTNLNTTLF